MLVKSAECRGFPRLDIFPWKKGRHSGFRCVVCSACALKPFCWHMITKGCKHVYQVHISPPCFLMMWCWVVSSIARGWEPLLLQSLPWRLFKSFSQCFTSSLATESGPLWNCCQHLCSLSPSSSGPSVRARQTSFLLYVSHCLASKRSSNSCRRPFLTWSILKGNVSV